MIAHLCRLVWNRRRTNLLLVGELILSFLVLTPLVAGWMLFAAEQLQPLGFEHEGAWSAMVMDRDWEERDLRPLIEPVWRELRALDEVQAVALLSNAPLRYIDTWEGIAAVFSSDEGLDALGLRLLSGRWFEPADEALDWTPAVIDATLSRALFGDEDPLGKVVEEYLPKDDDRKRGSRPVAFSRKQVRVVGVVEDCFFYGTYGDQYVEFPGFIFLRYSNERLANSTGNTNYFLVRSHPSIGPAFGEKLRSLIQAVVPASASIKLDVKSLTDVWASSQQQRFYRLGFIAAISGLMMLMVALGLVGMMWQNVRRRTREIGIRRATGAPGGWIYGQFLGELAVLVTVAIGLGCVPIVQFGLLDLVLWSQVPAYVVAISLGATALVLYLLVLLCGLYPSWLAAKVRPVEALHHD